MNITKKKLVICLFVIVVICTILYTVNQSKLVYGSNNYESISYIGNILYNNNIAYNVKKELNEDEKNHYQIYVSPSKYSSATKLIIDYLKDKN